MPPTPDVGERPHHLGSIVLLQSRKQIFTSSPKTPSNRVAYHPARKPRSTRRVPAVAEEADVAARGGGFDAPPRGNPSGDKIIPRGRQPRAEPRKPTEFLAIHPLLQDTQIRFTGDIAPLSDEIPPTRVQRKPPREPRVKADADIPQVEEQNAAGNDARDRRQNGSRLKLLLLFDQRPSAASLVPAIHRDGVNVDHGKLQDQPARIFAHLFDRSARKTPGRHRVRSLRPL